MNIQELKKQSSEHLITEAEKLGIENASTLRKQEILFAILKKLAEKNEQIKNRQGQKPAPEAASWNKTISFGNLL